MARAKTARTVNGETVILEEGTTPEEQAQEDLHDANDMEGGDLFAALDEMRGTAGVTFIIVRTFPSTPEHAGYVGSLTPAEFSLERMTELYGPGKYRVRVKGAKGWLPGGGTVAIAKGIDRPAGASGTPVGDVAALLKAMTEKDEIRRREESERRGDLLKLTIPAAITGLTTVLAALLGKQSGGMDVTALVAALKPSPGPSLTDLTAALANMKTLSGGDKAEPSQIENFLNILEKVKDLAGNDKGESNWTDVVRDVIREGLPAVKPLLENLQAQQAARAGNPLPPMSVAPLPLQTGLPSSIGSTAPVSPTPGGASASSTLSGENDMMAFAGPLIRAQCEKLAQWAQEKKRVELYAEVLLEELPAIVHQYVTPAKALEYLNHPQWFEILKAQDPRLSAHLGWCDAMRREVIEIIQEQMDEAASGKPPAQVIDPVNGESPE